MSGKIFVVTGANKGIGYGIVETLSKTVDGGIIYLTARNENLGKEAVKKIEDTLGSSQKSKVVFHQLDVSDESSVKIFAEHLKKIHNKIDVLINNAGVNFLISNEDPVQRAELTIDINYYGVRRVSHYCDPLLKEGGRIVNVCSQAGVVNTPTKKPSFDVHREILPEDKFKAFQNTMNNIIKEKYSQENADKLINASDEKVIDEFVEDFKKSVKEGNTIEAGFPTSEYRVSKAAEIAFTMVQHQFYSKKGIKVNGCCPGYVKTDLTKNTGFLTIYEGADTPVYLAIDPYAPDGKFVYRRRVIDWY